MPSSGWGGVQLGQFRLVQSVSDTGGDDVIHDESRHLAVIFTNLFCCHLFKSQRPCSADESAALTKLHSAVPPPPVCQVVLALASKTERAVQVPCESGLYAGNGECCEECPPGEGVVKKCGATQTVCSQCLDSEWNQLVNLIMSYDRRLFT